MDDRKFEGSAAIFGGHRGVAFIGAKDRWVDVERTAGDHHAVDLVEIGVGLLGFVGQSHRKPTSLNDGLAVIFA